LLQSLVQLARLAYIPERVRDASRARKRLAELAKEAGTVPTDLSGLFGVTPYLLAHAPQPAQSPVPPPKGFPLVKWPLVDGLYSVADFPSVSNSDLVPDVLRTYPYTHRPLVDFVIGAPQLAFWHPTFSRAGMQRALAGILPNAILSRASKGNPRPAMARLAHDGLDDLSQTGLPPEPAADWQLVKRGYVRHEAVERAVHRLNEAHSMSDFLSCCVLLEAWLRSTALHVRTVTETLRLKTGTANR
jgi:hypothetical protein